MSNREARPLLTPILSQTSEKIKYYRRKTMNTNEIITKAKELKEYKRMKEEIEAMIASIEDEIKASMGEAKELIAGEYKITYKTVNSSIFDSKSFKEDFPDLAECYITKRSYRRFNIA